jgi:hypothetical protein
MTTIVYQVLKLVVAVVVSLLLPQVGISASSQDKAVITLLIFVTWTSLEMAFHLRTIAAARRREEILWRVEQAFDGKLINIRRSVRELLKTSYGDRDLFIDYFAHAIEELRETIHSAGETRSLQLKNYHFRSMDSVMAAFEGAPAREFRELWNLDDSGNLFDSELGKQYFAQIALMAARNHITSVKTVFTFPDQAVLERPEVKELLSFYASWRRFDCRLIRKASCDSLMGDEGIGGRCIDFGIYGNRYLFKTTQYNPEVVGVFTKDSSEIHKYISFFDRLWLSTGARRNPEKGRPKIPLSKLVGGELVKQLGTNNAK